MTLTLAAEAAAFRNATGERTLHANQLAALSLICGVDLDQVLGQSLADRVPVLAKLSRLIERERLRGARRHWSYDLNRHIALKQALDRLAERATRSD